MAAQCQWPMRSFWVTGVVTDHNLLHSEPGTTQMSLMLNLVTSTKAHEYAASLGLIDNMKVCDKCVSTKKILYFIVWTLTLSLNLTVTLDSSGD